MLIEGRVDKASEKLFVRRIIKLLEKDFCYIEKQGLEPNRHMVRISIKVKGSPKDKINVMSLKSFHNDLNLGLLLQDIIV